jgi:diadenylate cyclase
MLSYTTVQTIVQLLRMVLDILVLWLLIYYGVRIVRNNARTSQIFKGIVFILLLQALSTFFGLTAVSWLAGFLLTYGFLGIIIVFQPEIRSLLERIGKTSVFSRLTTLSGTEKQQLVEALNEATLNLSSNHVGALITLEQGHSLSNFIATGTKINALVSNDLLQSIFNPSSPLHDGAVIIQGDRMACASAYFPPTTTDLPSRIGARHRAAIGISEITDSITIVVSEKSGNISIAERGVLTPIPVKKLKTYLEQAILFDEMELDSGGLFVKPKAKAKVVETPAMEVETVSEEVQHPIQTLADLHDEEIQRKPEAKLPRSRKAKSGNQVPLELSVESTDEPKGGNPA